MARILGGGTFGEMRGKLGSSVFSRNRSGAIIRQYIIPIDVRSTAQLNARASFGSASSSWHSLTSEKKTLWQDFADLGYVPKNGTNSGQYSGFQAHTSLANVVANASRLPPTTPTIYLNGSVTPITVEALPFQHLSQPPSFGIRNSFLSSDGAVELASLSVDQLDSSAEIGSAAGNFKISLKFSKSVTFHSGQALEDSGGNSVGFAVYGSSPVAQQQNAIKNDELICLGYFPAFLYDGTDELATSIQLRGAIATGIADLHRFYKVNDWVRMTAYLVSRQGQMFKIGNIMTQVAS